MRFQTLIALMLTPVLTYAAPKPRPTQNEDGSGPRAALLMYDKMVGPNEVDKALPLYFANTTRERALAAILAKCDGALANLHKIATDKYGKETADAMIRSIDGTTADDINAAKITVTGDQAYVAFPNSAHPTEMIRVNGEWKISVKALVQDLPGNLRDFRKALTQIATAVNQTAAKISEGQYTNADEPSKQLLEAYKAAFSQD
jgi:hypothetical protein